MYFYFSSDYPAVIKLNGIYYGTIHNSPKNINADTNDPPFIEICPLDKTPPTSLILDQACLSSPPERVSLTDLNGGYALRFYKCYTTQDFKVFAQSKFSDAVVTAFSENGYKLSIETPNDFYAESLFVEVDRAEIKRANDGGLIAVFLYGDKTLVNIYQTQGEISKVFSREVDYAEFDGKVKTEETLSDIAKHKITIEWEYAGGKFTVKDRKVQTSQGFDKTLLNVKVLPYAFLEEILVGGDYKDYLGGTVKDNANKLSGFLGEFIGVMPPPVFRDIEEVGLIYPDGQNKYKVEYFRFEIQNREIVNLSKS